MAIGAKQFFGGRGRKESARMISKKGFPSGERGAVAPCPLSPTLMALCFNRVL